MKIAKLRVLLATSIVTCVPGILTAQAPRDGAEGSLMLEPAEISVREDTLHFKGAISEASWQKLSALAASGATQGVTHMVVTSPGGDTGAGRKIGQWVHDNITLLEVEGMCFSSCANYLFPAADQKIIRDGGFVGWHGTERTSEILALSQPGVTARDLEREELRAAMLASMPELEGSGELDTMIATEMEKAATSRLIEAAFFTDLGLDDSFAYFGLLPGQLPAYLDSGAAGWTYSLADMACFGVENVTFAGAGAYHHSTAVQDNVHVLDLSGLCE